MHVPHHDEDSRPIQAAVFTMLNGEDTGNRQHQSPAMRPVQSEWKRPTARHEEMSVAIPQPRESPALQPKRQRAAAQPGLDTRGGLPEPGVS